MEPSKEFCPEKLKNSQPPYPNKTDVLKNEPMYLFFQSFCVFPFIFLLLCPLHKKNIEKE